MTEKRGAVNRKIVILRDEYSANMKKVHVKARGAEVSLRQVTYGGWRHHADSPEGYRLRRLRFASHPDRVRGKVMAISVACQ